MNMFLALAVVLAPPDPAFVAAQEEFVVDATPLASPLRGLTPLFGEDVHGLVGMLGCVHHYCREVATRLIEAEGESFVRPLVWASRHRDPEVRHRAEGLLRRLIPGPPPCQSCRGLGILNDWECSSCHGSGLAR